MKIGEYTNTYSNPQALKDLMKQRAQQTIFEAGDDANHERAKWVEATRQMLGNDMQGKPYTFGRILGLTKSWDVTLIRDRYYYCVKQNKPAFVWWGIRKQDAVKKSV